MKPSASSVLTERRRQRRAVTPTPVKVRHVKFTPEEMAYDPPPEETEMWTPVGRGPDALFAKPPRRGAVVELDADVAKVFKDAAAVNNALRKLIEAVPQAGGRKRRSA